MMRQLSQPTSAASSLCCRRLPRPCLHRVRKENAALRPSRCQAASVATDVASAAHAAQHEHTVDFEFVCPICQEHRFSPLRGMPTNAVSLSCPRCNRSFAGSQDFVDLTLTSGMERKGGGYNQRAWLGTELFRSPLVSFAYERGWRQAFSWAGFPGVDIEFDMAMQYLKPAYGKVLLDMSCGSGLFSRRFARSGKFSGVIAADFSENMLKQAKSFFQEDQVKSSTVASTPLMLLRADVGRLPFATGSVAAVHAGAAIHCWPNPQAALAEISRVLAPGGVFVGSTFMFSSAPLGQVFGDENVRPLRQLDSLMTRGQYRWWEESELKELFEMVGLQDFRRQRQWRFIMFAATKPDVEGTK